MLRNRFAELRAAAALAAYSDRELLSLLPYFDEVRPPPGRRLALEGRSGTAYLVVAQGRLQAWSGDGECRTLLAGDSFGWNAMWERGLNDATVVVETDARLLVMGHAQFRALKALGRRPAERSDAEVGLADSRVVA